MLTYPRRTPEELLYAVASIRRRFSRAQNGHLVRAEISECIGKTMNRNFHPAGFPSGLR
jgi:hypothetical protein